MKLKLLRLSMLSMLAMLFAGGAYAEDVTATWDFKNRIPSSLSTVAFQGNSGDVDSDVEGIKIHVDATTGKFNVKDRTNDVQVNAGTIIQIPVKSKQDVITIVGNYSATYSIDGGDPITDLNKEYTASLTDAQRGYVEIKATAGSYFYSFAVKQVTIAPNIQEQCIYSTDFTDWVELSNSTEEKTVDKNTTYSGETITFSFLNNEVKPNGTNSNRFGDQTGWVMAAKAADTYITTSALKSITKVTFVHGATGSNRGYKLEAKGDGDADWIVISESVANPAAGCTVTKDINKTNCQLRFTNLTTDQNAYMFNLSIYANVDMNQAATTYTLTTNVNPEAAGSVSNAPTGDTFEEGQTVKLTATPNFGYKFINWTDNTSAELGTETTLDVTMNADKSITANFEKVDTYELALNTTNGAKSYMIELDPAPYVLNNKNMYETGTVVTAKVSDMMQWSKIFTFTGWSDNTTANQTSVTMNQNQSLSAIFEPKDYIAAWDFYKAGNNGRIADFSDEDNTSAALSMINTEGTAKAWLDKSYEKANGYENFKGCAVNWQALADKYYYQIKINAQNYKDIHLYSEMLLNYNGYSKQNVEYSLDGETWNSLTTINIEAVKTITNCNITLPEAANYQANLYIRWIPDYTSDIIGATSNNDGTTIANIFITGDKSILDDGKAPTLQSSTPAANATGVSATGKIVLTFDEKIQITEGTKATLNNQKLTPTVAGKVITFDYIGLNYSTAYTFTLPANTVSDLTNNKLTEAITINFTTMARPTVTKVNYDVVVSNNEELSAAITAANNRSDKTTRFRIFVKKGEYQLPTGSNKTYSHTNSSTGASLYSGSHPDPITYITAGNISFIGEDRDATIITNTIDSNLEFAGQWGTASVYDGIGNSDVLQIAKGADNIYFQDITIKSGMKDARGRNLAIQDKATNTIYKNTCLSGYQDTWTSNNQSALYYFEGGIVRGRTDYLCGKGDAYFNGVELMQVGTGGYPIVPSTPKNIGWVFKDCILSPESDGVTCTLGRPWGSGTPAAYLIDTKMNVIPEPIGWSEMSNGWPKRFAEYNSMTAAGAQIDLSGRKTTFASTHENNPILTAEEAAMFGDMTKMFGDWQPTLYTEQAPIPGNVALEGTTLSWTGSDYALLYAICKNGSVIGFTTETTYTIEDTNATYTIRAANEMGGLSEASEAAGSTVGIKETRNGSSAIEQTIYTLQGVRVSKATKGLYIINGKKVMIK